MKYAQVIATREGDNVEHGTVYFGETIAAKAKGRFLVEFPEYDKPEWKISVKIHLN